MGIGFVDEEIVRELVASSVSEKCEDRHGSVVRMRFDPEDFAARPC